MRDIIGLAVKFIARLLIYAVLTVAVVACLPFLGLYELGALLTDRPASIRKRVQP